jgi:hypothetical protein|tara:strand:- start:4 stop:717 length:714 start_codon:yes stop_codon:yes gene_type:complete
MSGIVGSRFNTRGSGLIGSVGTDGQVFTSSGAGVSHTFEDVAGGKETLLSSTTITSDTDTFDGDQLFPSTYNNFVVDLINICTTDSGNQDMIMYMRSGGAGSESTYTGNVEYSRIRNHGSAGFNTDQQGGASSTGGHMRFHLSGAVGNSDDVAGYYRCQLFNVHSKDPAGNSGVGYVHFLTECTATVAAASYHYQGYNSGHIIATTDYTGFHLLFSTGDIRGANNPMINVYGVNNIV